ncbi:MAG: efflux RND transporter periplasmic adaptor subunit [Chthonomonadales bacterium]
MTELRRSRLVGFCVLAAISLPSCRKGAEPDAKPAEAAPVTVEMAVAELHSMEYHVTAQGTVAAAQGAGSRIAAVAAGRVKEVLVKEGDHVTAGQVIARIDDRVQKATERSANAAFRSAIAQANQVGISSNAMAIDNRNFVQVARLAVQSARLDRDASVMTAKTAQIAAETDLKKLKNGARPQEVIQAEQAVNQAKATRDRAATEAERVNFLFTKGIDSKRQQEDAQTALSLAESGFESAKQQLSLVRAGNRPEEIQSGEIRVRQAKEAVAVAESAGNAKIIQAEAALKQADDAKMQVSAKRQEARAALESASQKQADLNGAQAGSAILELRAPSSGTVVKRNLNPGDLADTTNPIVEISDTRRLDLVAGLPADDGLKVRVGMVARVTSPDAPGATFGGRVVSVGQVDSQSGLLTVRISLDNSKSQLHVGSFCSADVILSTLPHALTVPKKALVMKEDKPTVYVVGPDGAAHVKEVTIGAEDDERVEITKNLKAGEKVVTSGQYGLSDGAKVQPPAAKEAVDKKDEGAKVGEPKPAAGKD